MPALAMRPWLAPWLGGVLALPWIVNLGYGPSVQVPQACVAAAAGLIWFALRPADAKQAAMLLAGAWLAAACANAFVAILQYTGLATTNSPWISAASAGEAIGNLRQRNHLATLLAIGLASAFYLAARLRSRGRAALMACVALLSIANALTSSRTGLLQWLALAGAALLVFPRNGPVAWRRWGLLALGTYAVTFVLAPVLLHWATGHTALTLLDRVSSAAACASRKVLWSNAAYLAAQRFWTGWGLGEMDYAHFVTLYPADRFCLIVDNAHNLFLQVAVELGVPAAAGLLAGSVVLLAWQRPWSERRPERLLGWAVLGLILLHSMVEYPLWYGPFQLAALFAATLLWPAGSARAGWLRPVWIAAAAAALVYVAWDYHRISQVFLPDASRSASYRADPWAHARRSWLFRPQVEFAEFTTTPLTRANALEQAERGRRVLHYSPEPKVAEKLIDALLLLGRKDEALWYMQRFLRAFPAEYETWSRRLGRNAPQAAVTRLRRTGASGT